MKLYHKLFSCSSHTILGWSLMGKKRKPYKTKNITHSILNGYIEDFNQIRTQQILEGNYEKKVNQPTTTTRKKSIRKKKKS